MLITRTSIIMVIGKKKEKRKTKKKKARKRKATRVVEMSPITLATFLQMQQTMKRQTQIRTLQAIIHHRPLTQINLRVVLAMRMRVTWIIVNFFMQGAVLTQ